MKRIVVVTLVVVSMLTACEKMPTRLGGQGPDGVMTAPALPPVVVLDAESQYSQGGFHYRFVDDNSSGSIVTTDSTTPSSFQFHYEKGHWFYARSKDGPWSDLPIDHYPKNVSASSKVENLAGAPAETSTETDKDNRDNRGRLPADGSDNK